MCTPPGDTRNREEWCEKLFRNIQHCINKSAVEVNVSTDRFQHLSVCHDLFTGDSFYAVIKCEFIVKSLFRSKLLCIALQNLFSWVGDCVDCVSHSIDQSRLIKGFFIKNQAEILTNLIFVSPVFDRLLNIIKHPLRFQVCTTMTRSFQRTDGSSNC